ncbi:glycerophosphoryl diester phosphodiesterase [Angomonas deanei]|nr:glycerophosphoryl diester phosphodiesterase [Angomonas deanei]|eukprot:EPY30602.1 glycerophosphoryl diester phosphodiesterase [Angomonas deanei]
MKSALVFGSAGLAMGWAYIRNIQLPMGPTRIHWGGTVFGHRGCRGVDNIPENTLEAFQYAVSCGCGGVECDVRLSKDNELVIFHDTFAGSALQDVPETKRIDEFSLFELKELRFTTDPTSEIRIPTLEETVMFCRENNLRLLIEVKELKKAYLCTEKVLDLYRKYPDYMYEHTTLISFHPGVLYHARQKDRKVATGAIYARKTFSEWVKQSPPQVGGIMRLFPRLGDFLLVVLQEKISPWVSGCSLICPKYDIFDEAYLHRWNTRKIGVYLWGFQDKESCTLEMRQPGVCVAADNHYADFQPPKPEPDFDIFGDRERERQREMEEQYKRLRLQK